MATKRLTIVWQREIVGFMENPKSEMFHLYGRWISSDTNKSKEFVLALEAVENDLIDEVIVFVDEMNVEGMATLDGVEINVRMNV